MYTKPSTSFMAIVFRTVKDNMANAIKPKF